MSIQKETCLTEQGIYIINHDQYQAGIMAGILRSSTLDWFLYTFFIFIYL